MNTNYTQLNTSRFDSTTNLQTGNSLNAMKATVKSNLTSLQPGQVFTGQITDIRNGYVSLNLDQQTIQATFEGSVNLCIGEVLQLVVKENNNNRLVLAPVANQPMSTEEHALYKALDAAELPATDKNIDLVSLLLKQNMPVDKNSIHRFIALTLKYPDVSMDTLIIMVKNHIDITPENLKQFEHYQKYEHQLTDQLKQLAVTLPEAMKSVYEYMGNEETNSLITKLLPNSTQQPEIHKLIQLLSEPESQVIKTEIKELFADPQFAKVVKEEMLKQWSLNPNLLSSEQIEGTYQKIQIQLELLSNQIQTQSNTLESLAHSVKDIQDNIQFMKSLNENLIYAQLPLQLSNQVSHSELFVYTKKKNNPNLKDGIHLILQLDMEYLGHTSISIHMQNKYLNLKFSMNNQKAVDVIQENMETIQAKLEEKGLQVQSTVEFQPDSNIDLVTDFLGQGESKGDIKHYSFDMRV